jgi:hypothetical protein
MSLTARLPWPASVRASEDSSCLRPLDYRDRLASERAKTVHALDRSTIVTGGLLIYTLHYHKYWHLYKQEHHNWYPTPNIRMTKSSMVILRWHIIYMEERVKSYEILFGIPEGNWAFGIPLESWEDTFSCSMLGWPEKCLQYFLFSRHGCSRTFRKNRCWKGW